MAITRYAGDRFTIGAGETKPTGVLDGAVLIDTGNLELYVKRDGVWVEITGAGTDALPGAPLNSVQFNDAGSFGGDADLTFTDGNRLNVNKLGISGIIYDSNNSIGNDGMVLTNEGTTGVNWKAIEDVLSGVGGSGVANYVARWADEDTLTSGVLYDNGTNAGVGTVSPLGKLDVLRSSSATPGLIARSNRDGAKMNFAYTNTNSMGEIGMTYYNATGGMQLWVGGNLNSNSASHVGPTQQHTDSPSWYSLYKTHIDSDFYQINRISTAGSYSTPFHINGDGNVGVGTINPGYKLEVSADTNSTVNLLRLRNADGTYSQAWDFQLDTSKDLVITGNSATGGIKMLPGSRGLTLQDTGGDVKFTLDRTDARTYSIYTDSNSKLHIRDEDASADRLTILSNGNVGIGTDNPKYKLDANAGLSSGGGIAYPVRVGHGSMATNGDGVGVLFSRGSAEQYFGYVRIQSTQSNPDFLNPRLEFGIQDTDTFNLSDASTRMVITGSGSVGIGTVTPATKLDIFGQQYNSNYPSMLRVIDNVTAFDTDNNGGGISFGGRYTSGAVVNFLAGIQGVKENNTSGNYGGALRFLIRENGQDIFIERVRIDSFGNVGIGTDDPVSTLEIVNNNESTTQTNFTQALSSAGLIINTQYTTNAYTPGLFWKTSNSHATKPKAGIYLKETSAGTNMYFGTSNNYSTGITNDALVINPNGRVGIGTTDPASVSQTPRLAVVHNGAGIATFDATGAGGGYITITDSNTPLAYLGSSYQILSSNGATTDTALRSQGDLVFATGGGSERMRIDSSGNVGIGTTSPLFKLHVNGDIYQDAGYSIFSNSNRGWYRQNYVTTGAGVSNGKIVTLNPPHGQTASNVFHYIFELTTAGTSTNTGATYIGVYNADTSAWVLRAVSLSGGSSNHPQLSVSGNNFTVYTNHSSNYTVVVSVTSVYNGDADSTAHSLGANYQWQRAVNDLYYNDGLVGIGTGTPSQKLHVQGNLRVTGAYYDSNNQAGSSGEILSSTGSGTDWVSLCQISGVTANGSQSTCYIPKWTDGTNEVIGNSVIYENASGNIGINCTTPSYKLHVNGSFAATCKSFVIDHPTKCGHMLRYGSLESPYHGVRLTGKSCTIGGEAKVSLPNYMCGLVHKEDINVQITNYRHGCTMWVDDVDISNNNFRVKTETEETKEFYWTFTAERKDVDRMQTEYKNV